MFESPSADRVSDFELRLMDIDSEQLGIPDTEYAATVKMPSSEFARIVRDLASIGDTVVIAVTKDGVKFSTTGDAGSANITLKQHAAADAKDEATAVECSEPVTLSFALRYLNSFAKAAPLSPSVTLSMSKELPIVVSFQVRRREGRRGERGCVVFFSVGRSVKRVDRFPPSPPLFLYLVFYLSCFCCKQTHGARSKKGERGGGENRKQKLTPENKKHP